MIAGVRRQTSLITCILLFVTFAFSCSAAMGLPGDCAARLDPALRALVSAPRAQRSTFAPRFKLSGADEIGVITEYTGDPASLRAAGARVRTRIGTICTADIPVDRVSALAALPGVTYIQAARRFEPVLDISVPETGAAALRSGTPPDWSGYTGRDVVVGAVDTGIDTSHQDFLDTLGQTRVLYIWDQTTGTGGPNHPPPYDYGTEWTKAQIDAGLCTERDTSGHGTAVMAIAAGNGSATGNGWPAYRYVGMAPEADIIAVKSSFYDDDIVDGMSYIMSKASSLGKPFVINLSIGSQYGAHDGTDLIERAIDQISGPGAVLCTAAGNNGTTDPTRYIHADWTTPTRNSTVTADINVLSNRANPFYIDLWYEGNDSIDMKVTTPNGYSVVKSTGSTTGGYVSTPDGNIWLDNSYGGTNPYNDDHECLVAVQDALPGNWSLTATGKTIRAGGHCDAWILGNQNVFWSSYGSNSESCTIPGTSVSVITVAGYLTKSWWYNPDGTLQGWNGTYGSYFTASGEGPTRDGRQKPELAVPTAMIATARSVDCNPTPTDIVEDGVHAVMAGTSAAVPHMTGAVALMLQKDPSLTAAQVTDHVVSTARADSFTGPVPNTKWGAGKLSLEDAMALVPLTTDIAGARAQPDDTLVRLAGQVVSAGIAQLTDRFYIESADRGCGIQARFASGDQPDEGDRVKLVGVLGSVDGERAVLDSAVTQTGTDTVPKPISMVNLDLGGGNLGDWTPGVTGGTGVNNIGLLVTAWGKVTHVGTDYFYVNDGAGLQGSGGYTGVKVYCPGLGKPAEDQFALVTGISSVELDGAISRPLLRPRKQSDLLYY